jgi:hypothetical protein
MSIIIGKFSPSLSSIFCLRISYFRHLFYWIFVPVVQAALDEFCIWWNQRVVRWQSDKDMPSGHVPDSLMMPLPILSFMVVLIALSACQQMQFLTFAVILWKRLVQGAPTGRIW